jgi:hypothetical protein
MARLLDLFAVLLAPLTAALDQEFGRHPATTPAPVAVAIAPVVTPAPAEPLYTRRGSGGGTRYDVAHPDAAGPKFRKLVKNGRAKYLPA